MRFKVGKVSFKSFLNNRLMLVNSLVFVVGMLRNNYFLKLGVLIGSVGFFCSGFVGWLGLFFFVYGVF